MKKAWNIFSYQRPFSPLYAHISNLVTCHIIFFRISRKFKSVEAKILIWIVFCPAYSMVNQQILSLLPLKSWMCTFSVCYYCSPGPWSMHSYLDAFTSLFCGSLGSPLLPTRKVSSLHMCPPSPMECVCQITASPLASYISWKKETVPTYDLQVLPGLSPAASPASSQTT